MILTVNRASLVLWLALLCAGCQTPTESPDSERPAGAPADGEWAVLFDGSTLDGWNIVGVANWRLDPTDRSVTADAGTEGHLVSDASYDDFELVLEFWVEGPTNSGVYIRCSDPSDITAQKCYEVNISDARPDPTYRTGAIVGVSPPLQTVDAGGRWNTYQIRAGGERLTVTLNGIVTVDTNDSRHSEGVIGLQYSTGPVKFRNIRIRPL